jgi:hypothetical protein
MTIAIEATGAVDPAGTTRTYFFTDKVFATGASDTPPHTAFKRRIMSSGGIARHVFSDGRTGGVIKLDVGNVDIANDDAFYDDLHYISFDGRPLVIYSTELDSSWIYPAYPAGWQKLFAGTIENVYPNLKVATLVVRDKLLLFDKPTCPNTYAGTNVLPSGFEGTGQDIKGQRKARVWGVAPEVEPRCSNTSLRVYDVNDGAVFDVPELYHRGSAITKGADYTSQADMIANDPGAGNYRVWKAGGKVRIGFTPSGKITCKVVEGATSADRTYAQVLKRMALAAGLSSGEISSSHVTALDTEAPAEVGVYVDDEKTFLDAMTGLTGSTYFFGFSRSSEQLVMGRMNVPSGSPAATIQAFEVLNIERRPPKDVGIPAKRVTVWHSKIWATQSSDIAGVALDRQAYLAEEYRKTSYPVGATTVDTQWKLAPELEFKTSLVNAADGDAEAVRLYGIYSVRRDIYDVTIPLKRLKDTVDLMAVVRLTYPRFGLDAGRDLRVIGMEIDLKGKRAILSLWG